jgi:hypothetical protein
MIRLITICFACFLGFCALAQQEAAAPTEFAVMRADRVFVSAEESTHLNCSIVGTGDGAQFKCESQISENGEPLVYHVALLVGSNKVGYVVSCGVVVEGPGDGSKMDKFRAIISRASGGGTPAIDKKLEEHHQQRLVEAERIACPLSAGQVVKGSVESGNLHVSVGSETKIYRIETSAYIGPLGKGSSGESAATATSPSAEPADPAASVKLAVHTELSDGSSTGAGKPELPNPTASTAKVMVSSEPAGGDIYVDGNFMGNTPSLIELLPGSHAVRIEVKGQKPWSRVVSLTAGSKVTIQAVLGPAH